MSSRTAIMSFAALFASACSDEAGAPSKEQNREMENAAEMLDQAPGRLSEIDDRELLQDGADRDELNGETPRR